MGILDMFKKQLRSVIQWENPQKDQLFHLWSENGDEIKNASKLLIQPGQGVIFVYEGKIKAIHLEEGLYELSTSNIPFLTTLTKLMQSFESEHKVGIYFFWQTEFLDQKWGTPSHIKYVDPVYSFPVRLMAHGNFSFKIITPEMFFVNVVGGGNTFSVDQIREVIVKRLIQPLGDVLAKASFGYTEIDKNREELSVMLKGKLGREFEELGFLMTDFRIEGVDFDQETQARIGKIADTIAETESAKAAGINYEKMQQLQAMRDAARNEGGAAGAGVGIGAGIGLGQMMAGSMFNNESTVAKKLEDLKDMLDKKLITQEEYDKTKTEVLKKM